MNAVLPNASGDVNTSLQNVAGATPVDNPQTSETLAYFARYDFGLRPCYPATKIQDTSVEPSCDSTHWRSWLAAGRNIAIDAFHSEMILADIDVSYVGRERGWEAWRQLCMDELGLPAPLLPYCQTARQGWHILIALPPGVSAKELRGLTIYDNEGHELIGFRVHGYCVAPPSYYDGTPKGEASGPYMLLDNPPAPHPCPPKLLERLRRGPKSRTKDKPTAEFRAGTVDPSKVLEQIAWLKENRKSVKALLESGTLPKHIKHPFNGYNEWIETGMQFKLEGGDAWFSVWEATFDRNVNYDEVIYKWNRSFDDKPQSDPTTIATWFERVYALGCPIKVPTPRPTASEMFAGLAEMIAANAAVAQIAADAGAKLPATRDLFQCYREQERPLPADTPAPGGAVSLAGRDAAITKAGKPALAAVPTLPAFGLPQLPPEASVRGLFAELNRAIPGMIADPAAHTEALAFLALVHEETFNTVASLLPEDLDANAVKLRADGLACEIDRGCKTFADWQRNGKTQEVDTRTSDNVIVFLKRIRAEVRYNAFLEQAQARKSPDDPWQELDDNVVRDLHMTARSSAHQFYVGKDLLWDTLLALAHHREEDPVLDHLAELQGQWDGVPRLATWLTKVCGTLYDAYHVAVGRNVIGGLVRRLRHPGCKHDTMAVFQGPQGGGKSTLAKLLAIHPEWFSEATVLGEECKELILQLAGRTVLEIPEMGQRSTTSVNEIKAMLSRTEDSARLSYDRALTRRQRRSIFVGTTNDYEPLNDPTGGRRFLPVKCIGLLDLEWLKANLDQLYAEAAVLESQGHDFQLAPDLWGIAAEHQERARQKDDQEIGLREHFEATVTLGIKDIPESMIDTHNAFITAGDLTELAKLSGWPVGNKTRTLVMKALGFADPEDTARPYVNGKQSRIWLRGKYDKAVRYIVRKDSMTGLAKVTPLKPL